MTKHKKSKNSKLDQVINNRKLLVLAVLVAVLLLWLAVVIVKDVLRHQKVVSVVNEARTALEAAGFENLEDTSGCGDTGAKFGKGNRVCATSMEAVFHSVDVDEARRHISNSLSVIDKLPSLVRVSLSNDLEVAPRKTSVIVRYTDRGDHLDCTLVFNYLVDPGADVVSEKNDLYLRFACVDTPWFARTFLKGQL